MKDEAMANMRHARKEMFAEMNAASMANALPTVYEEWLESERIGEQDIVRVTFSFPVGHQPSTIHTEANRLVLSLDAIAKDTDLSIHLVARAITKPSETSQAA